jgi:thermitase
VVVAAAGNKDTNDPTYPAASPGVIAVAATNKDDKRASFSNYGNWVDVAAPGVKILSTIPRGYASWSGTSMATPHVSALAALLASQGRSRENIEDRITSTTVDLGPNGRDPYYGAGRISADRAVR